MHCFFIRSELRRGFRAPFKDEFVFHRFKEVVIKLEAHLQSVIGDTLLPLEQVEYLVEDVIDRVFSGEQLGAATEPVATR